MTEFNLQPHLSGELVDLRRLGTADWEELYSVICALYCGTLTADVDGQSMELVRYEIHRKKASA